MNNMRLISFNCFGAMNKLPVIRDLCDRADIIFLQETWCMPHELGAFDTVNADFYSFSVSAVNDSEILIGRPHGGLSILWRKSLGSMCRIVTFDDARILGLRLASQGREFLVLNVYLPYYSADNVDLYLFYVGKIASILEQSVLSDLMILGDFNASVDSRFFREWNQVCEDFHLSFADVETLPGTSYTHVNNCSLTRSWIDHCLCTETVRSAVTGVSINYNYLGSDHFPLMVTIKLDMLHLTTPYENMCSKIKWEFNNDAKVDRFFELVGDKLALPGNAGFTCSAPFCERNDHRINLETNWASFSQLVCDVGKQVFGLTNKKPNAVPGWNIYIKEYYERSRSAFLNWRNAGSPRSGSLADAMRFSRARFKYELRQCRSNEEQLRSDSLAHKMQQGNPLSFWRDVRKLFGDNKRKLPQTVDGITGDDCVAQLWKHKYSGILNSVEDSYDRKVLSVTIESLPKGPIKFVSATELSLLASELGCNMSAGCDGIPSDFYKNAPVPILHWLAKLFNGILSHAHVPSGLSDVTIKPILKNNLRDPSESGNYRPIAVATCASKLLEKVILHRMEIFLQTSSNQFGFKKYHSTDMCIYALKETINYYYSLSTPTYACFLDIKSAFDRVSHGKLFCKLASRGVPAYIVLLLYFWYKHQRLSVQWGTAKSDFFPMSNGIRQGSIISPYLFNIYVDELNGRLSNSKVGCHIGGMPSNNFAYADDLAILAPSARGLNKLLQICEDFAKENLIEFSPTKTVVLLIAPPRYNVETSPNIYLGDIILSYVTKFKYLGHIISCDLKDDDDIDRARRNLSVRGNVLIRNFSKCTDEVKCRLFRIYCYPIYGCPLWSRYKQSTMSRLRVCYNTILRKMLGVPCWNSARGMFVGACVRSLPEVIRYSTYSLLTRVDDSTNVMLGNIACSDASVVSNVKCHWYNVLSIP